MELVCRRGTCEGERVYFRNVCAFVYQSTPLVAVERCSLCDVLVSNASLYSPQVHPHHRL